ncbi:MAG: hypothetical protein ACXVPU_02270 [Bacteroidia bacterium]
MKDNIKRKILKDRNFPDSGQINKHQNFDRIVKDHMMLKKLMMKNIIGWSAGIIGVAIVAGFVLLHKNTDAPLKSKINNAPELVKTEAYIQPPFPGKETPLTTYRICTKTGGVIEYPTGSKITIPANAFINQTGKPLGDSIDIKYREFHNPLEIFLSGIPMKYDSAGTNYTLESAGMIEILAFDKGDKLDLNTHTPIEIKMASATDDERFNLYQLDTINKNWIYKGKDKVEKVAENKPAKNEPVENKEIANKSLPEQDNMIKPAMSDPQKYCFKIAYEPKDFPELAAYENVLFEVTDNNFKPAYYKINWKKISLYNSDVEGSYIVKLKKADTSISVTAKPVFDKADYSNALAKFEEKHKEASKERDQKELDEKLKISKVNEGLAKYNRNAIIKAENNMNNAADFGVRAYRTISIAILGFHNCDSPVPPVPQYAYTFKNVESGSKKFVYSTIFLVEKGKNTVFRFSKNEPVNCDPAAKNLMWTITDKNEIAFFRIADYTKLANGAENDIIPVVAKNQEKAFEEIREFSK